MDAVQCKGLKETINNILAEFTFAAWDGNHEQFYYAYTTDQLAAQNPKLSRADKKFTAQIGILLQEFPIVLKKYPRLLAQHEQNTTRMLEILDKEELVIFPSFFKAIAWLEQNYPNQYALYLSTFGQDLPEVIPAIEQATPLKFAGHGKFEGINLSLITKGNIYDFLPEKI